MNNIPQLGEVAFGEPLVDAGFGPRNRDIHKHPIFTLPSHPELIIRALHPRHFKPHQPEHGEHMALQDMELAKGLLRLDEEYGLQMPGLRMAREVMDDRVQRFLVTPRITGFSFATQLSQIPEVVATSAFESVIQYHEDYLRVDGIYLDDVRLPQLMYGRLPGATEDQVYLTDVEQAADTVGGSERKGEFFFDLADQGIWAAKMLSRDISLLEQSYGKEFADVRKRVGRLLLSYRAAVGEVEGHDLDLTLHGANTAADRKRILRLLAEGAA